MTDTARRNLSLGFCRVYKRQDPQKARLLKLRGGGCQCLQARGHRHSPGFTPVQARLSKKTGDAGGILDSDQMRAAKIDMDT